MSIDWSAFTPWSALLGGVLIGLAAAIFALGLGRIAGISGILGGFFHHKTRRDGWRISFVLGLLVAPWLYQLVAPFPEIKVSQSPLLLIVAGLLVGIGTRYGSGCTSGHGVCGLSRFSPRSMAATAAFMGMGFFTVWLMRHVIGGL